MGGHPPLVAKTIRERRSGYTVRNRGQESAPATNLI
jgi:hypothetical protein